MAATAGGMEVITVDMATTGGITTAIITVIMMGTIEGGMMVTDTGEVMVGTVVGVMGGVTRVGA